MAETTPDLTEPVFGVYRPVALPVAEALQESVCLAGLRIEAYLRSQGITKPVKPYIDFGITCISRRHMRQGWVGSFSMRAFTEQYKRIILPGERRAEVTLGAPVITPRESARFVQVALAFDPQEANVRFFNKQSSALELITGIKPPTVSHLGIISIGGLEGGKFVLAPEQQGEITRIVADEVPVLGKTMFERMLPGTGYREPLPGFEEAS